MIVIIDYGMGNLASVLNMLTKIGAKAVVTNDIKIISSAKKIILPGVGSFDHGIKQLHAKGIYPVIKYLASCDIPILGICLGMQLLGKKSEEGILDGLGLVDVVFKHFYFDSDLSLPVPHVGWNTLKIVRENNILIDNVEGAQRFYFTHSYHAICNDEKDVIATANYGNNFSAAFNRGNIYGVQFHPEKSHRFGMELMRSFAEI